jgi:hypothetical protein
MRKTTYFEPFPDEGWPEPNDLRPYFLAPPGQEWTEGNDSWGLSAEGLHGTEGLAKFKEQVEVHLNMWGYRGLGVLLFYQKYGGGYREMFTSKGDMSRLREVVYTSHGDRMPAGLYIPFPEAWKAVKEFIETDGELPKSIEWVANKNLPPNTFPEP